MDIEEMVLTGKGKLKIRSQVELAKRLGMSYQLLGQRMKDPALFRGSEISAMAKLFNWNDNEIAGFIRCIKS